MLNGYTKTMLDDCTKTICSIKKQDTKYIFKDCNETHIWETDNDNLSQALRSKTKQYIKNCQDTDFASDDQMVWILATKDVNGVPSYKNVAVCKYLKYAMAEINVHIKQLVDVIQDKSLKAQKYNDLWNSDKVSEIVFQEVSIDMYIEKLKKQTDLQKRAPYIYTLISINEADTTMSSKSILRKNQAEFIEGKIAKDYNLKISGIWNPSSLGIDGDIYNYYDELMYKS